MTDIPKGQPLPDFCTLLAHHQISCDNSAIAAIFKPRPLKTTIMNCSGVP